MAINGQLLAVVQHIEAERGVSREIVLTAIEQAILQAARRNRGFTENLRVEIDRKTFEFHVYDTFVCSDEAVAAPGVVSTATARRLARNPGLRQGDTVVLEIPAAKLGRIAAQTSRQQIMQKIREAERTNTLSEYKDRVNDIVTGTVTAIVHRDIYVTAGKTEMILPAKERIPGEDYQIGDPIKALVKSIDSDARGPSVLLSRTNGKFLEALFRLEVSEISDGVVEIMGVARDPGFRAKIAVRTNNEKVDPVGACVGQGGNRVRNIVRELHNEKIDIVRWNEDVRVFVAGALAPAKLESVEVDTSVSNTVHVTVSPDQYSLAIGKRGQNVRLTTKLTGWHVEVKKSLAAASFEDRKAEAIKQLAETFSIPVSTATQVANAGFLTVEGIVEEDEASFIAATGLDEIAAKGVYAAAQAVAALTGSGESAQQGA